MTKEIRLSKGQIAIIDDGDYMLVSRFKWHVMWVKNRYYAASYQRIAKGVYRPLLLHRLLMDAGKGQQIDHINGDTLDCTRNNLRFATNSENQRNRIKHADNTSGYKGVDWMPSRNKWRARICVDRVNIHIGLFHTATEAAVAYDEAALTHHGAFARLNFTPQTLS